MYRKNLQITTEQLREKTTKLNLLQPFSPGSKIKETYCRSTSHNILTAILILVMTLPFFGCESGGTIGSGIITDGEGVEINTFEITQANVIQENSFSGRLTYTPAGHVEDPLFGTIRSTTLLKPAITQANLDSLREDDKIFLQLILRDDVYGSGFSESHYEIYEVAKIWRGNQLRYNQEIEVDFSSKVGEFQVSDSDSINVELSEEWKIKFAGYFNNQEANRDSLYRNNFTGLAIVPSTDNRNLRFFRTGSDPDQPDLSVSKFIVKSPADEDEGEDGDNGEDNGSDEQENITELGLRDWGASFIRSNVPDLGTGYVLHNTETILQIISNIPYSQFSSKNIVNAQLVLTKNNELNQSQPDFDRFSTDLVQIHVFDEIPADIMGEIFVTDPNFFRVKEEDDESFRIDITQYVMDQTYGEENDRELYLTTQLVNGLLYSTIFYDHEAPADLKPRIVITTIR